MGHEDLNEQSVSDLLHRLSQQTQTLVRDEIRLALLELQDKGKRAGIGAGLFGAGGLIALFAIGTLIAAIVLLLATAVEAWLAALIVAAVLLAGAGLLALGGKKEIEQAIPPAPTEAIESTKHDVEAVKEHVGHRSDRMARR
ncbi:MAG: phage holin family protein [Solirubrobacteraceae bacterium]